MNGQRQQQRSITWRKGFYPSVRTILLVRFDSYQLDRTTRLRLHNELLLTDSQRNIRQLTSGFTVTDGTGPNTLSATDIFRMLRQSNVDLSDSVREFRSPDGLSAALDVTPLSCTRTINSYRQADELTLTLNWRDLPLDARIIRSILVFHYEGTVPATAWRTGERERVPDGTSPTGYALPAIPQNLRWVGFIDEIGDDHGEGDVVTMRGRDLTALFIDSRLPVGENKRLKNGITILDAIKQLKDTNPNLQLIHGPVMDLTDGETIPVIDIGHYDRLKRSADDRNRNNADKMTAVRRSSNVGEETYWDAITDLCLSHGVQPMLDRTQLILFRPRTLYKNTPNERTTGRAFPTSDSDRHRSTVASDGRFVRRMVYGENVRSLRFHRKLGRIKAPTIEIVAHDPDAKDPAQRRVSVYYPDMPLATKVLATGSTGAIEVKTIPWSGVVNRDLLLEIAKQTYEAIGRQELGVTMTTNDPTSYIDDPHIDPNDDPDLLDLRAGDPIEIMVTPNEQRGSLLWSLTELSLLLDALENTRNQNYKLEFLKAQGFSENVAVTLLTILDITNLPSEFRLNTAQVSFDKDSGYAIQMDLRDYVRVRADPTDIARTGGVQINQGIVDRTIPNVPTS